MGLQHWVGNEILNNQERRERVLNARQYTAEEARAYDEALSEQLINEFKQDVHGNYREDGLDSITDTIREVVPGYQVRDTEGMAERTALRRDAEKAVIRGEMKINSSGTKMLMHRLGAAREDEALLVYAEQYMPEASDELNKLNELINTLPESFLNGSSNLYPADTQKQILAQAGVVQRMAYNHFMEHAEEYFSEFSADMSDRELIDKYADMRPILAVAGEMEKLTPKYPKNDAQKQKDGQIGLPMVGFPEAIMARMDFLASPLGGAVDYNEFKKLTRDQINEIRDRVCSPESPYFPDFTALAAASDDVVNAACTEARRKLEVKGDAPMLAQSMDGKVMDTNDPAFLNMVNKQEPFFMVPKDDPTAKPVLVQPISTNGGTRAGDDIRYLTDKEVTKIPAAPKPNAFVRGWSSFAGAVGSIFGQDWRVNSCVRYQEYKTRVDNTVNTYRKLNELTSEQRVAAAGQNFVKHSLDAGKTMDELTAAHTAAEQEKARLRGIEAEINRKKALNPLQAVSAAEHLERKAIEDFIRPESLEPDELARRANEEAMTTFESIIKGAAEDKDVRRLLTTMVQDKSLKTLYTGYRTAFYNDRKLDVGGMLRDAAKHKESEPGRDLHRVLNNEKVANRTTVMNERQ